MDAQHNVETLVVLQPVAVDTASLDRDGMLVMANGMLVGVLVRLVTPGHEHSGAWFVEAAFGHLKGVRVQPFDTLDDATRWFRTNLKRSQAGTSWRPPP
ncbi:hypothetical protein ASG40_04190 [Methylobacterium sp. Leaf399]|uniref:hypothetical protein n=1 Tax=unclassified Methylobacterium TaxID=2615210 RepID=UPI0006F40EB8|nr:MULTISPECIES: hypothetical protein [unclassified Methylobacterium]KQP61675.1 hypothetical protein ASF39_03115 [Methylobacterium sp. Leaf108]KQT20003.1 hypothetical protein ASG40_04190 [Methylobacterium sp. Leaf399]KQT78520.1 hypothetical protein ASG59_08620 [Methylobacterium sp. Leaf466]